MSRYTSPHDDPAWASPDECPAEDQWQDAKDAIERAYSAIREAQLEIGKYGLKCDDFYDEAGERLEEFWADVQEMFH